MHGHACMAAGRAGRPHGAEQSRARTTYDGDDLDGRRAGLDDDGDAGAAETTIEAERG